MALWVSRDKTKAMSTYRGKQSSDKPTVGNEPHVTPAGVTLEDRSTRYGKHLMAEAEFYKRTS